MRKLFEKKPIIDEAHKDMINSILKEGQLYARERRVNDFEELENLIDSCKDELPENLPVHALENCILSIKVGAKHFPSCYNGIPYGTHLTIKFRKDGKGELVNVERVDVNCMKGKVWKLTDTANSYIAKYYLKERNAYYEAV